MDKPRHRFVSVMRRSELILRALRALGPMSAWQIANEIKCGVHIARYSLKTLVEDKKIHLSYFDRTVAPDGAERNIGFYVAGDGPAAVATVATHDTAHLQPIYIQWAQTRTPDIYPE